ncbi:hypothetical protein H5410_051460 [Solanum commersonii]|uniref:Uncharacterized protein n=1 Tax=Solanum commersonii TaxID=4109 RepID=A0A9J5WY87_SOLCO|nr:hypothetical protein H5410_051460 [Solanum commersonii]
MNMFTITADNAIEILKEVTDNTLCEKIIQLAASKISSSSHSIPDDKKVKDDFVYYAPYSLCEVHNRLSSKQTMVVNYTFITEPVSRDINVLIEMKQKHINYLQLEIFSMNIFDTLKATKVHEKIKIIS